MLSEPQTNCTKHKPSWEAESLKFPKFYGTWRFTTMFTTARHWSLPWARCIQSTSSHPVSLRSILIDIRSRDSSVTIVRGIRVGRTGFDSRQGVDIFFLRHRAQTGSGAYQTSYPVDFVGSSPGRKAAKQPGRVTNHLPPSRADITNVKSHTSTTPYVFIVWCLVKQKIRLHGVVIS
jgi:hypothetical protein